MKRNKSSEKIGRNDPCWCGSGKKYKKCHLHREDQEPIQPWEIDKEFKRVLEQRRCLAPSVWKQNCSSQISRAHSVPRSGSLSRIARDGHVYSLRVSVKQLMKTDGSMKPQLVGINKASTFTGFCSRHDRSIFAPLENMPFTATPEQCFLLSYRAFARETFTKQAMHSLSGYHRLMDRGRTADLQYLIQTHAAALENGYFFTERDLRYRKSVCDEILITQSYHRARAYVIELEEVPLVMCCGAFYPEQDFDGHEMQDLSNPDLVPHSIAVTSFHGGKHGAFVLSWVDEYDPICVPFAESLHGIGDDALTDALLRLLFGHFENIHIQPHWWENLSTDLQEVLMARFHESVQSSFRRIGFLTDDGVRFRPWTVVDRRCVGFKL